jgi:hypothetical protein
MNILIKNNKVYKFEKLFKPGKFDINNNPFPILIKEEPFSKKEKKIMNKFIKKLEQVEKKVDIKGNFYTLFNIYWNTKLKNYIKNYNLRPTKEFMEFIERLEIKGDKIKLQKTKKSDIVLKLPSVVFKRESKRLIKLTSNQLRILDALMIDGGYDKKYFDKKNKLRFSEHAGLLDFSNTGLDKIVVSGKTDRMDRYDHSILLPDNMIEAYDYEYIFHTHPPTPIPGGRVDVGILYEFPSVSDIFHFMDHYNNGVVQGSIVVTPEGIYIIRAYDNLKKIHIINEEKVFDLLTKTSEKLQDEAIKKYGEEFTTEYFYSKIAQDKTFINKFNQILKKYNIKIYFFPRMKIKNIWTFGDLYLKVSPIEPQFT